MDPLTHIQLLEGLLAAYSPTLEESPAVDYLAAQMQLLGFAVEIAETGSLVGSLGDGPREILLLGHIDTVPGLIPVRQEGGRLYGRGAVDAKGPLACFTAAAAVCGARPGWRLVVAGATGEEGDSRGAKHIRDRRRPDLCIIGEPSGWDRVTLAYKGSAWLDYTVRRPLAHTAGQAESACEAAVRFWIAVQARAGAYNAGQARVFDQLTPSLREMHSARDGFFETARLAINLRLPPALSVAQAVELLDEEAGDGELRLLDGLECYRAGKNTPLVRAFLPAIRAQGGQPAFVVKTGTSDMNVVGPAWEIPILAYGPGDSNLDHTPEEHVVVEEYLASIRVLADALARLQE
jgi:LysW-gamma-L-lysine carboxypeptidase